MMNPTSTSGGQPDLKGRHLHDSDVWNLLAAGVGGAAAKGARKVRRAVHGGNEKNLDGLAWEIP